MSLKISSRSIIWGIAGLLSLFTIAMLVSCSTTGITGPSEGGSAGQEDSSADSGVIGETLGDAAESAGELSEEGAPLNSCPEGPIFMEVEMLENWTYSPGGVKEIGEIDGWGRVTCMVEISGSKVAGEVGCYFEYFNEGFLETDAGHCDIKGQCVAIAKIKGSCDNLTVKLEIDETVEPDEETDDVPMTANMTCREKTYPHITYFPFTWFEVEVPLAAGTFESSLEKADCPLGFLVCDKIYTFRLHDPELQE
jgi:hypothetical protein